MIPESPVIVLVTLAYAPIIGGAERQAQILLERWARLGQESWVVTRRVMGSPNFEVINGVQVYRVWSLWWPGLSWITFSWSTWRLLSKNRQRIGSLWSFMLNAASLAAVLSGKSFERPVVIRISASGTGGNLQELKRSWLGPLWLRFQLNASHKVITLNEETVKELQPYAVPAEKIKRISNGVDGNTYQPASTERRNALRSRWGLVDSHVATLFVGRLDDQKNVKNLIQAWKTVAERNPQARMLMVGDGPYREWIQGQLRDLRLEGSTQLLGQLKNLLELYQVADLFILPSYYEGQSNALLEAMACELPALVSRIPGNVDIVQDGQSGLWVDPQRPGEWIEPWLRLIQDANLRRKLGQAARRRVMERFSADATFNAYQDLKESLQSTRGLIKNN